MLQLKSLPTNKTHLLAPLIIAIIALCCFIFDDQISRYFIYDRQAIHDHQYWRLLTGHLFHTNVAHLILNLAATALLWALHGQFYTTINYAYLFILSSLFISVLLYLFDPNMAQYVGLSGVLHAFFVWGAMKDIEHQDKTGFLLLIGVIVKVTHEQIYGANQDVINLIDANVAINAHLWGSVAGLTYFLIEKHIKPINKK